MQVAASRTMWSLIGIVLISALIAGVLSRTEPQVAAEAIEADLSQGAVTELLLARNNAPFELRVPSTPSGFALERVLWEVQRDGGGNEIVIDGVAVFSADLYYSSSTGDTIHVWQTNNPEVERAGPPIDPASDRLGPPRLIDGVEWIEWSGDFQQGAVRQLGTRLSDGITISIDGTVTFDELGSVAASAVR